MRTYRFFINQDLKKQKFLEYSDKDFYNQIRNVLRFRVGEKIIVFDDNLNEAEAEILNIKKDSIKLKILEVRKNLNEPDNKIILYCSILKHKNFDIVVQKATEIGIQEIFPLICKRTVKFNIQENRLRKIIKEAAEQSGRGCLPFLYNVLEFSEAVKKAKENNINFIFDKKGEDLKKVKNKKNKKIGIFIGPEGGWTERELALAQKNNFKISNLGRLTLRAETAAIIASYLMVNSLT